MNKINAKLAITKFSDIELVDFAGGIDLFYVVIKPCLCIRFCSENNNYNKINYLTTILNNGTVIMMARLKIC